MTERSFYMKKALSMSTAAPGKTGCHGKSAQGRTRDPVDGTVGSDRESCDARRMRNPDLTAHRILDAATAEFAALGFAGARVNTIARRARINKRMLYYYFGSKRALFDVVLTTGLQRRLGAVPSTAQSPVDVAIAWYQHACEHPELVRLLLWQGLDDSAAHPTPDEQTTASVDWLLKKMSGAVGNRRSRMLDARFLLLALAAVSVFPLSFPQITVSLTGLSPRDPRFQKMHAAFLQDLFGAG